MTVKTQEMNKTINMLVFWEGGRIMPLAFSYEKKKYDKLKVLGQWRMRKGHTEYAFEHFALSDGVNRFEVVFSQEKLEWRLHKVTWNK